MNNKSLLPWRQPYETKSKKQQQVTPIKIINQIQYYQTQLSLINTTIIIYFDWSTESLDKLANKRSSPSTGISPKTK